MEYKVNAVKQMTVGLGLGGGASLVEVTEAFHVHVKVFYDM